MIRNTHESDELMHYGVLGMKWGVRRYLNKDGSLTSSGRKRVSNKYKTEISKADKDLQKQHNKMYMTSYNEAAKYMNNGGIDKFNKRQEKKYGKKYTSRDGYMKDYERAFNKKLNDFYNKSLNDFYTSNKHIQKAQEFSSKYKMEKWDELAKSNAEMIAELRKLIR